MSELKPCPSIELSGGLRVLVSEEDYESVSVFKWYAHQSRGCRYAARKPTNDGIIYMHRFILECPEGMEVDHINGVTLDNRRENLRIVTHRENLRNQAPQAGASSQFKGVYWSAKDNCWRVQIKDAGRMRGVGGIAREDVAAAIYDLLALDRFGEHARTNDPDAVDRWNRRATPPRAEVDVEGLIVDVLLLLPNDGAMKANVAACIRHSLRRALSPAATTPDARGEGEG